MLQMLCCAIRTPTLVDSIVSKFWVIGAAAIAALFFSKKSHASTAPNQIEQNFDPSADYSDAGYGYDVSEENEYVPYAGENYFDPVYDYIPDDNYYDAYDFQGFQEMSTNEQKLNAFLFMIRSAEHVYPRDVLNNACYNIFYGGDYFTNMSDHPVNTGEMRGVPLPAAMCIASGFASGKCVSTAAGAYQIIRPTWNRVRSMEPRIPDFSQASQDEAARRLLAECGALPLIYAGDVEGAVRKASKLWASLPGSSAQQNPKSLAFVLARYEDGINGMA